jgi:stearoyl-CoA desaturase (delta-9 desaturase)
MNQMIKNFFTIKQNWGILLPMHVFGLLALYNIFTGSAPEYWWAGFIIGYVLMKMLGVGAGFHRLFSHHGFAVNKLMKRFILWCGTISGQGSAILWVAIHRGGHHRFSDTERDPHSPIHGFWHSYILWMFKLKEGDINPKGAVDLLRDPDILFAHKYYHYIVWASHALIALISFDLWLYAMALPALATLHVFCCQTSIVHYTKLGYKNYETKDDSVNVPWLWFITQGECWHNNHHGDPKNPNYGSRHWWELDPTWWIIKLVRVSE